MKEEAEIFFFSGLDELLDDAKEISRDLQRVPVLTRVLEYTLTGWLYHEVDEELLKKKKKKIAFI